MHIKQATSLGRARSRAHILPAAPRHPRLACLLPEASMHCRAMMGRLQLLDLACTTHTAGCGTPLLGRERHPPDTSACSCWARECRTQMLRCGATPCQL